MDVHHGRAVPRRQHQIGDYILDFFCAEHGLVVELDGAPHETSKRQKHDAKRDSYLKSLGHIVLRFENKQVFEDTENLLVPSIVLYEVFKKISLDIDENKAFQAISHLRQGRVVDLGEAIALYAAQLGIEKKLPMADALIYATAILHHATVYTQDAHFEGLPQVRYFAKPRSAGS